MTILFLSLSVLIPAMLALLVVLRARKQQRGLYISPPHLVEIRGNRIYDSRYDYIKEEER